MRSDADTRVLAALLACAACGEDRPAPGAEAGLDLAAVGDEGVRRVYGSTGDGSLGLPVAGGADIDGDGHGDVALGAMQASPLGALRAGEVFVVWGDGEVTGAIDTGADAAQLVRLHGSQPNEYTGSEIWVDDVTGDGLAEVLIGRQNHSPSRERPAAGALSVVLGGEALRAASGPIALDAPPPGVTILTLLGAAADARLGIWLRTGDVTGDGVADLLVGADQEAAGAPHAGAVYLIAGGPALAQSARVDLAAPGESVLAGQVARVLPPGSPAPEHHHFGATCLLADLDGNGRAEVLASAALSRAGAVLDPMGGASAHGFGGPPRGAVYIAWDDNFPPLPWPDGFGFALGEGRGSHTVLRGGSGNARFGEELVGGLDWDADGAADLYVGDLTANVLGRPGAGVSHVVYDAARLRGLDTSVSELGALDPPLRTTTIAGIAVGDISGDTAAQGDFDGDGLADLVVCSPHHNALRRHSAGALHVFFGRAGGFPVFVDLAAPPSTSELGLLPVFGARGTFGADRGDTLCYSAASGDLNADGLTDLIVNEMVGNGLSPAAEDVGNLLVLGDLRRERWLGPGE